MLQDTPRPSRLGRRAGPGLRSAVVATATHDGVARGPAGRPSRDRRPVSVARGHHRQEGARLGRVAERGEHEGAGRERRRSGPWTAALLEILNSDARTSRTSRRSADRYYNLWQDKDHERGLWRRTTLAEYRKEQPAWETVLDLDALRQGREARAGCGTAPTRCAPDYTRCLISLSRGGADADVVREFDLDRASRSSNGRLRRCPRRRATSRGATATRLRRHRLRSRHDDDVRLPADRRRSGSAGTPLLGRDASSTRASSTDVVGRRRITTTRRASSATSCWRGITFYHERDVPRARRRSWSRSRSRTTRDAASTASGCSSSCARDWTARRQDVAGRRAAGDQARRLPGRQARDVDVLFAPTERIVARRATRRRKHAMLVERARQRAEPALRAARTERAAGRARRCRALPEIGDGRAPRRSTTSTSDDYFRDARRTS